MNLEIPADVSFDMAAFVRSGRFADEAEVLRRAMALLRREEEIAAIQAGIDEMEAGRGRPWEEVDADIRAKLGFKPQ